MPTKLWKKSEDSLCCCCPCALSCKKIYNDQKYSWTELSSMKTLTRKPCGEQKYRTGKRWGEKRG